MPKLWTAPFKDSAVLLLQHLRGSTIPGTKCLEMAFFQNGKLDGKLVSPGDRRMEDDGRGFKFSSTMFCKFVSNGVSFAFITFLGAWSIYTPLWSWKNWRLHQDERKTPNPESPATIKSAARFTAVKMIMMSLFTSQSAEATFAFGNFEHREISEADHLCTLASMSWSCDMPFTYRSKFLVGTNRHTHLFLWCSRPTISDQHRSANDRGGKKWYGRFVAGCTDLPQYQKWRRQEANSGRKSMYQIFKQQ